MQVNWFLVALVTRYQQFGEILTFLLRKSFFLCVKSSWSISVRGQKVRLFPHMLQQSCWALLSPHILAGRHQRAPARRRSVAAPRLPRSIWRLASLSAQDLTTFWMDNLHRWMHFEYSLHLWTSNTCLNVIWRLLSRRCRGRAALDEMRLQSSK